MTVHKVTVTSVRTCVIYKSLEFTKFNLRPFSRPSVAINVETITKNIFYFVKKYDRGHYNQHNDQRNENEASCNTDPGPSAFVHGLPVLQCSVIRVSGQ